MYGQYRVLTPTMYRSRVTMAATRQAVSMDAEDRSPMRHRVKKRRKGEEEEDTVELALRPASLSPRVSLDAGTNSMAMRHQLRGRGGVARQQQDSLELELGASATRVWGKDKQEQEGGRGHSGGSASSYRGRSNNSGNCQISSNTYTAL